MTANALPLDRSAAPLPRDDDAEVSLLAAVLAYPEVAFDVASLVEPAHFAHAARASLWSVVRGLVAQGVAPDPVAVRAEVTSLRIDDIDLPALATELAEAKFTATNAAHYANLIRQQAALRRVVLASHRACEKHLDGAPAQDIIDDIKAAVEAAEDERAPKPATLADALQQTYDELVGTTASPGISFGWVALDSILGPVDPGSFLLLGARPSMGKTALALNIASNVAEAFGPVLFLSLEMPRVQLCRRLLATQSGVPYDRLRPGRFLDDADAAALKAAQVALSRLPILIDDASAPPLDGVAARIRRAAERDGARLVVIDYLGLIAEPRGRTINSRENVVGTISRALKAAAKDAQVPILALSQLNRESDRINRGADSADDVKPPALSDLRDSGSLEQDADAVLFLHRPAYYTKDRTDTEAQVIVAKNRNGTTDTARLTWHGSAQRFEDRQAP